MEQPDVPTASSGSTSSRSLSPPSLASLASGSPRLRVFFAVITQVATWAMQILATREILPEWHLGSQHLREKGAWLPVAIASGLLVVVWYPMHAFRALRIGIAAKLGKAPPAQGGGGAGMDGAG